MGNSRPELADGFVVFVKRDCPTCELIVPVLEQLCELNILRTIFSQDDASFPKLPITSDDTSLEVSFSHRIETVPTLLKIQDGIEVDRTVGWSQEIWKAFLGIEDLGSENIRSYSPGCGSLSVDPDLQGMLQKKYGSGLVSREVTFASAEDEFEAMYDRGWSDGLPLIPPTIERVQAMLEGTSRKPDDIVALVPPNLVDLTVEKIAINAVMAGCKPEYLPVVITALETACSDEFNMHGLLATTMPVGPVFFVNGPIRKSINMNSGMNLLGQGNRANSTIGRAVQLTVRNVGGGRPGEVDRATHGSPAKYGLCFAEDEEGSPWQSYAQDQGFSLEQNTVTLFPGEGPRMIVDQLSRSPDELARSLAMGIIGNVHPKLVMGFDAILIIGPEHASRFAEAGWTKEQVNEEIINHSIRETDELICGANGISEGLPEVFAGSTLPKLRPDGGLIILYGGGAAGLFSATIGGWLSGDKGSSYQTREITL
ncbi:MAG: thiol reductase thioredoxin [Acidimicrobiaceae bacterium]|nr:thiol reductase thioredoxin [Acidimicrobiaceae bacterium]|tara:strand:+ start:4192 stop:5640 length:1449 start_codon:yes stop_codon:yes gene_type:complete